ncbi:Probable coatomer subunit zeta AltName: Full=Zeta-coat protein; Short=Zeta-COP [Serendipita indica DSM 11827]|uniref:Coatomer subunit zeta n=1 Tax=Serendipita indica (strain DSM 11827) TaxID=1109443 RepID=G4T8W9_SERID|nr:Probable coatomer subunit zeta AltName: Full=Zeta-coat protein; Short=Zeta-COP [Serendipita indica DSM 11827]CCA67780.1 probable RET3-coatomer complex zeta chain [Serendipita indica DSM 11827]
MNLSLYSIAAFIVMDTDGHRVMAKYYRPKHNPLLQPLPDTKQLTTLKEQKAFEKGLWEKTKKPGGDVIIYDSYLALYKHSLDLIFYLIGPQSENELMLSAALNAYLDAISMLLRNQVEKRSVLENLDIVVLCLDETIDDGIILETDSSAIASRVSRPRVETSEMMLNEQSIMNAYQTVKERMQRGFGPF